MAQTPLKLPPGAQLVDDQPAMKLPPGAELVPDDTSTTSADTDFTSNPNGEGLYRMMPASVQGYTDTSKEIQVPFSRVNDAQAAGLHLHPDEQPRYTKDAAHQGEGKTLLERASARVQGLLQPSTGIAGQIPVVPGVDINAVKAAGRVVAGLPEFAKDLASVYYNVARGNAHYSTLLDMVDPGQVPMQLQQQFHEDMKKDPKLAADNLIGTLLGMGLLTKAPEAAKSAVKGAAEGVGISSGKPAEVVRNEVRDTLGVWENTRRVIGKFTKDAEKTREENKDLAQKHAEKTQDALHATHGAELKHEADVRLAESKAAEENAAADQKHLEETQEALHKTAGSELEAEKANRAAKIDALKNTQKAERKYRDQVEEVREHNEAVLRDRAKRVDAQKKLDSSSKELDDKIAEAQKKAKSEDDAAWDAWRAKIGNTKVNLDPVTSTIKAQEDKMNPQQVAEFRDILKQAEKSGSGADVLNKAAQQAFGANYDAMTPQQKTVIDSDFAQRGVNLAAGGVPDTPISKLHGWKTQLEEAVRSDRAGNIKYAIGQVLDSVRTLEEDVSKQAGADKELAKARALHGPYVDTFRNPQTTPSTAANYVRSRVTPNFTKDTRLEAYITRLGGYDPSIPKLVNHIDNLQEGLKSLPKDAPLRDQIKPYPPRPEASTPPNLKTPERAPLPDRPVPVKPAEVKPPERTAPPDRPQEVPQPEAPNLQAENAQFIADKLRAYGKYGQWVVRLLFGGGMAVLMKGKSPEFGGDLLLGSIGVNVLTHALRSPRVLDWLAKPSTEDMQMIANLPPEDAAKLREAIGKLAEEEREKDPKAAQTRISPIMAAWLAGGKAAQPPSPDEVKKRAEELKPAPPPGPQSLKITHFFNPTSGQIEAA